MRLPPADRLKPCPKIAPSEADFAAWFRRERPDALLVNHAHSVLTWLHNLGQQVPRDVGVIELENHLKLGCAGVYYDPAKIGALAVEMLVGLLHRNETGVPGDQHEI